MGNKCSTPPTTLRVDSEETDDIIETFASRGEETDDTIETFASRGEETDDMIETHAWGGEESAICYRTPEAIKTDTRRSSRFFSPEMAIQNAETQPTAREFQRTRTFPKVIVNSNLGEETDLGKLQDNDNVKQLTKGIVKLTSSKSGGEQSFYDGMAFVVKSGETRFLYTAKHNFLDEEGNSVDETMVHFPYSSGWDAEKTKLGYLTEDKKPTKSDCEEVDITPFTIKYDKNNSFKVLWRYGIDIHRFGKFMTAQCTSDMGVEHYEVASGRNCYKKKMKIGIVVWNIPYKEYNEKGERMDRPRCLGNEEDINIYRGEIVRLSKFTIETSYNSFRGCSGAPVICIDERVEFEGIYGKVIAVHAGYPSAYKDRGVPYNVAFKVAGNTFPSLKV